MSNMDFFLTNTPILSNSQFSILISTNISMCGSQIHTFLLTVGNTDKLIC